MKPGHRRFRSIDFDEEKFREISQEERKMTRGYHNGLEHLVSKNFLDLDGTTKPTFGVPTTLYGTDEPQSLFENIKQRNSSNNLWGVIAKNLLGPLSSFDSQPYILKAANERKSVMSKIKMQEFAIAHNIPINENGYPDLNKIKKA